MPKQKCQVECNTAATCKSTFSPVENHSPKNLRKVVKGHVWKEIGKWCKTESRLQESRCPPPQQKRKQCALSQLSTAGILRTGWISKGGFVLRRVRLQPKHRMWSNWALLHQENTFHKLNTQRVLVTLFSDRKYDRLCRICPVHS